jgi:dTDP-4-amino-4,6-dideoxygalactose transaminase
MIRLIKPYLELSDVEGEMKGIFDSGIFTKGTYSHEFPEQIARYTGASHAFLTTSATTALWMCLKAIGIQPGDEVAVSDFSFPATVNVVEDLGAKPVFIDVDKDTYNMIPEALEERITPAMKACMFVDALGNPSGVDRIRDICHAHGMVLIEDAACGMGSSVDGVKVGNIADLTCFSFHPRKLITCGEGGAITTNNDEYARFFSYKLNHGADPATGEYISYGYNFRMAEIPCLMGVKQLQTLDAVVAERREQQQRYQAALEKLGFKAQSAHDGVYHNMQSVVFTVPEGVSRDGLAAYLKQHEIESTIGTYCQSACAYYERKYGDVQPNGHFLQQNTITLPCYHEVDVEAVCDCCADYIASQS